MAREQLRMAQPARPAHPDPVGRENTAPAAEPPWVARLATLALHRLFLLLLCSAYLQGGYNKLRDFGAAVVEMQHFGLEPAASMAAAVIALEVGGALMVIVGWYRWLGALALAGFTLMATFVANRFWAVEPAARFMVENAFFEHLGLVGALLLVAWHDLRTQHGR